MQTTIDPQTRPARPQPAPAETPQERSTAENLALYVLLGLIFGIILVKSEAASWYRIQEMFRFQSFHMYGILGSAVVVAALSLALIKRTRMKTIRGEALVLEEKEWQRGYSQIIGGTLFGFGWALLGACPGPIYALIGTGAGVMVVALASAIAGAYVYGRLRPRLPH